MTALGRPREFDRDGALEAAMLVFWRKGFQATSISDLCEAMEIRPPSLYAAFDSKEVLYVEAVEHYAKTIGPAIWSQLSKGKTARAGVTNLLSAAVDALPASGETPAGCMVALSAVGEECPGNIPSALKGIRLDCLNMLRARLKSAIATGELASSVNIDRLSRFYFSVYQGMAIQARDGASAADLRGVALAAMAAWPAQRAGEKRGTRKSPQRR